MSSIPFLSLLVNCIVWSLYGWLKQDFTVFAPNFSGILVSVFCIYSFNKYNVTNQSKQHTISFLIIVIVVVLANRNEFDTIGTIGCVLSIIVSGSPLAVIKTVIIEKSTTSMPFTTSLVMWINNMSWTAYGYLVAEDVLIYGPNALSLLLSSLQLSLFVVYGFGSSEGISEKKLEANDESESDKFITNV